ncbi:polysaccharide biosynthesis C-terminal domain-containing protein [Mucilaginibacter sp. JRF]|uniref:murein biosynthesis integral membrane protein MurJ n=1 Tax=Mucilaginibacter sp. JRF TaxID=2780088 RepID=UPI00187E7992|nr:lipid II flippase MurJ [Mucilaginibacter sp. JRF]MBE9585153.1 polysaccharide biosynthesis C-terminal domain-containing protein [Mucilaginibacter sp. JRF]
MKKIKDYFTQSSRRTSVGLGILKLVKAVLTFFILVVSAKYFGASSDRDTWIIAGSIITVTIQILFGPINETFITKYIHIREEISEKVVVESTNSLVSSIVILSISVSGLIFLFASPIADLFAPGLDHLEKSTLLAMIKILIPSLIILEVTAILSSILNAYKSFFIPDLFSFISLILNIVLIIFLSPAIGIYSLIVSSYLSSVLLLFILIRQLRVKFKINFGLVIPQYRLIKPFFLFALPIYINYLFSQTDVIIERNLTSSLGEGSVSILDYARKFSELPAGMLVSIATTVLTPLLSLYFVKHTKKELFEETQKYFRFLILLIIPISTMFFVAARDIVTITLVHGKFSDKLTDPTSTLLQWYGLGLFVNTIYIVYTQLIIAQKRIYFFSKIVIVTYIVKICFNLFFYKIIGLSTFPISSMLANLIMGAIMLSTALTGFTKKVLYQTLLMTSIFFTVAISSYFIHHILQEYLANVYVITALVLTWVLIVEAVLITLLKLEEASVILNFVKSIQNRANK